MVKVSQGYEFHPINFCGFFLECPKSPSWKRATQLCTRKNPQIFKSQFGETRTANVSDSRSAPETQSFQIQPGSSLLEHFSLGKLHHKLGSDLRLAAPWMAFTRMSDQSQPFEKTWKLSWTRQSCVMAFIEVPQESNANKLESGLKLSCLTNKIGSCFE